MPFLGRKLRDFRPEASRGLPVRPFLHLRFDVNCPPTLGARLGVVLILGTLFVRRPLSVALDGRLLRLRPVGESRGLPLLPEPVAFLLDVSCIDTRSCSCS